MEKIELKASHVKILEARGLDAELLSRLGVQSLEKSDGGEWIAIPFFVGGKPVNWKYRTIKGEKRFQQDKDARKVFWNVDCLADVTLADQPLIVTEGEFDAIAALQCGYARVVSVPDGAPAEEIGDKETKKYTYLDEAEAQLKGVREIILCTDGDNPGANLLQDLSLRLGRARCKWVVYPKGCKDLNDALLKYGEKGVKQTIARAKWCKVDGKYLMSQLPPIPDRRTFNIGIQGLDKHYNIRTQDFCVVTGIPSHGKTAFVNDVCCHMVKNHSWKVAIASFEQSPQIDHKRNLRTWHAGKLMKMMSDREIAEADRWIDENFVFMVPDEDKDATLEWTLETAAAAILQDGCRLIVVDPWNEMDHVRPDSMSLTEYTGFAIKQFKKLAQKYDVHVIVAAHPAKPMRKNDGKLRIPSLYDVSDSAHWFNKPDVGLIIHRDSETKTTVRIAKSRYHDQIGKPGDWLCTFDPSTNRFATFKADSQSSVPFKERDLL